MCSNRAHDGNHEQYVRAVLGCCSAVRAGAVLVAALSAPAVTAARLLGFSKLSGLYVVRSVLVRPCATDHRQLLGCLLCCRAYALLRRSHCAVPARQGCFVAAALLVLRSAVERALGRPVGIAFVALTCTQFHLPYYASRPLANTFALVPTALALAAALDRSRPRTAIALLTFTTVRLPSERRDSEASDAVLVVSASSALTVSLQDGTKACAACA